MAQVTDVQPIAPGTHISAGDVSAIPVDLGGDGLAYTEQGATCTEGVTRSHDTHHTMGSHTTSHTTHEGHAGGVGREGKEPLGHKIKKMIPGKAPCHAVTQGPECLVPDCIKTIHMRSAASVVQPLRKT